MCEYSLIRTDTIADLLVKYLMFYNYLHQQSKIFI
mgnify:CR=1 FL=1